MFNLGKTRALIGLDIGSSSVKAVELKKAKDGYELVSFGLETLSQDTVVDGAIMDAPSVAEKIISIFDGQKIKTRDVATSVSGHSVIVKRVSMPLMTEEERAEASARARAWLVRLRRTLEEIKAEQAARWRRTELRGAAPDYVYSGGSRRAVESPRQHEKRFL